MTISFLTAFNKILELEGIYSNDPMDRGGETFKGISRKNNPSWSGWKIIDRHKLKFSPTIESFNKITDKGILDTFCNSLNRDTELNKLTEYFYLGKVWRPIKGDRLQSQELANKMFDIAVNMGTDTAIRFFQTSLNLLNNNEKLYKNIIVDGILGEVTLSALDSYIKSGRKIEVLIKTLTLFQGMKYIQITLNDSSQRRFFYGWVDKRITIN